MQDAPGLGQAATSRSSRVSLFAPTQFDKLTSGLKSLIPLIIPLQSACQPFFEWPSPCLQWYFSLLHWPTHDVPAKCHTSTCSSTCPSVAMSAPQGHLAVVGVVRCMGRPLGIAGELSSCALFVLSSGLAAFGCSTFACISIFFRCCICQRAYNSWVDWPGAPTFKFALCVLPVALLLRMSLPRF